MPRIASIVLPAPPVTVRVRSARLGGREVVTNLADFDPDVHQAVAPPSTPEPNYLFFVDQPRKASCGGDFGVS